MLSNNYYDGSGSNPIERGKLNAIFYSKFVKDFGSSSINKDLWPAQILLSLIEGMKVQCKSIKNKTERKEAAKLIKEFKSMYKTLINQ